MTAEKDAILSVLREHWPESGGQTGHRIAMLQQDRCAEALLRIPAAQITGGEPCS